MNVRETRRALEEGKLAGISGNGSVPGKTGNRSRSTKAPAVVGAVLAKRAIGENKRQIARELKISPNTVDKILDESEFDAQIAFGRSQAVGLIPNAMEGLKVAFAKGDGSTSCRFLEGIGVLGEDKSRRGTSMASDPALQVAIQNLYLQQNHPGVHSPLINMPFVKAQTQSNSGEGVTVEAQTVEQKTDTSS